MLKPALRLMTYYRLLIFVLLPPISKPDISGLCQKALEIQRVMS
jgi:hypothetical protein